jgi:hypothetical protein
MRFYLEDITEDQFVTEEIDSLLYDTTKIVLDNLLGKKAEKVDLTIIIDDDCYDEGCDGYCIETDKNTFDVFLGSHLWQWDEDKKIREIVTTLAHELVHVAQFVKGLLKNKSSEITVYEKKTFILSETDYEDLPWEKEAFALQTLLANIVINQMGE